MVCSCMPGALPPHASGQGFSTVVLGLHLSPRRAPFFQIPWRRDWCCLLKRGGVSKSRLFRQDIRDCRNVQILSSTYADLARFWPTCEYATTVGQDTYPHDWQRHVSTWEFCQTYKISRQDSLHKNGGDEDCFSYLFFCFPELHTGDLGHIFIIDLIVGHCLCDIFVVRPFGLGTIKTFCRTRHGKESFCMRTGFATLRLASANRSSRDVL